MDNNIFKEFKYSNLQKLRIFLESILIGSIVGIIVSLYRLSLVYIVKYTGYLYNYIKDNPKYIILGILLLGIFGYIVGLLVKDEPMIGGSGIPQIEGSLKGLFTIKNPLKVFIYKFIGGVLAIGSGLSLGIEGPSIQLGALSSQMYSKVTNRDKIESDVLISAGAGAGLAAAFNAPLAGVIFVLEEVYKEFNPILFIASIGAAVVSDLATWIFFGGNHILNGYGIINIPASYYIFLILLGIVVGFGGVIYNKVIISAIRGYNKIKVPINIKMIVLFVFTILFWILSPMTLRGGEDLINNILSNDIILKFAIVLLLSKFILSVSSFTSGTPGGILFPLLSLGALLGVIVGQSMHIFFGMNEKFIIDFIVLAMAGLFTSIVRAPITGIVLVCEMFGSTSLLGPLALVCGISYFLAELLGCEPIYDSLLKVKLNTINNKK